MGGGGRRQRRPRLMLRICKQKDYWPGRPRRRQTNSRGRPDTCDTPINCRLPGTDLSNTCMALPACPPTPTHLPTYLYFPTQTHAYLTFYSFSRPPRSVYAPLSLSTSPLSPTLVHPPIRQPGSPRRWSSDKMHEARQLQRNLLKRKHYRGAS